jgi:hypothetical protein
MTDIIFGKMSIYCFVIVLSRITGCLWGQVAPSLFKIPNKNHMWKILQNFIFKPTVYREGVQRLLQECSMNFQSTIVCWKSYWNGLAQFQASTPHVQRLYSPGLMIQTCRMEMIEAIMRKWMDNMVECWSESPDFFITSFGFTQNHIRNSFLIFY